MNINKSNAQQGIPPKIAGNFADDDAMDVSVGAQRAEDESGRSLDGLAQFGLPGSSIEEISLSEYGLRDPFGESLTGDLSAGIPQTFQAPPPRAGFVQRWVRFENRGTPDKENVAKMVMRKGWKPRRVSTIKENINLPTYKVKAPGGGDDAILMIAGHVLCEMPVERAAELKRQQQHATQRFNDSVKMNYLNEGHQGGVPVKYDSTEQVVLGRRPVPVAPDVEM